MCQGRKLQLANDHLQGTTKTHHKLVCWITSSKMYVHLTALNPINTTLSHLLYLGHYSEECRCKIMEEKNVSVLWLQIEMGLQTCTIYLLPIFRGTLCSHRAGLIVMQEDRMELRGLQQSAGPPANRETFQHPGWELMREIFLPELVEIWTRILASYHSVVRLTFLTSKWGYGRGVRLHWKSVELEWAALRDYRWKWNLTKL